MRAIFLALLAVSGRISTFRYTNGTCPDVDHIRISRNNYNIHCIWKELARYPLQEAANFKTHKRPCDMYQIYLNNKYIFHKITEIPPCGAPIAILVWLVVDFYNVSDLGAFRLAPYEEGSITSQMKGGEIYEILYEDYDMRLILADDAYDWIVLWGCDQINDITNRQSLHVLCNVDANCTDKVDAILEQVKRKIGTLGKTERVNQHQLECNTEDGKDDAIKQRRNVNLILTLIFALFAVEY